MNSPSILTAALLLAAVPALDAATLLTFQEAAPGAADKPKVVRRMLLDGNRVRVETAGGGQVLIFQADTGTLWVIDEAKRSYTEVHRSVIPFNTEEVKAGQPEKPGKAGKAGKAAEAAPAKVPPGGAGYAKVDSGFIVNGFRTDKYEATQDGRKVAEVYVAEPKSLGLDATALAALRAMAQAFAADSKDPIQTSLAAEVPGLPVRTVRFDGGKPAVQIDLAGVRQEEAPATAFEVPAGFTRVGQGLASGS